LRLSSSPYPQLIETGARCELIYIFELSSKTMLEYRDQRAGIFYLNLEIFISTLIGSSNEK